MPITLMIFILKKTVALVRDNAIEVNKMMSDMEKQKNIAPEFLSWQ